MREQVSTSLHWTGDWPWYVSLGVAAALALTAFFLYRRDARSGFLSLLLPGLRATVVFLIVLMLSGPVLHHRKVIGELARLIVCLDGSDSMQLTDTAMDAGRKIAIARRLGLLENVDASLDLPTASERLADARGIAATLAAVDASAVGDLVQKARDDFAARVAEADGLFAKAAVDNDALVRFRTELATPVASLAKGEMKSADDRTRVSGEIIRLGDLAGRWARDLSDLFQKQLDQNPASAPLKAALAKVDAMPRWQRVQALLLEGKPEQRILAELAKKHDVQVVLLENGVVKPLWQPGRENAVPPTTLPDVAGEVTNLTSGLEFAARDENRTEKGAVVMISDGQHNAGDAPLEAARLLAGRKMPVYTVGFGSQVPPRDLAVVRTIVPDAVFFEDRVRGEIVLKEEVPAGQTFTVAVKDGDKVVWEKQLVTEGRAMRRVPFEFSVKELAEARQKLTGENAGYEVLGAPIELRTVVSGLEGDREASNNEGPVRFRAVTQKRRILIVDGRPRWETRYLRNLFERDEKWEVNSVVAGATTDAGVIRGDKPGTFPNDPKLLEAYDLVIFGEVPKSVLRDEELKWLADFVGKRGGAMLFIDGARGALREYGGTPLGPLFPVEWPAGVGALRGGVKSLALSERAASLGAFALSADLGGNAETWGKLPTPHWLSGAQPLPGAETLIDADTGGGKVAAAVMRPFGAGRVYYQGFDDSWRWRYEVGDLYHVKFWNQLASFVAESPFAARDKYVQVDAGQLTYQPGEQADLRVRLRDVSGKPVTDAAVSAVLYRDGTKVATMALNPDEGGLYRGKTAALEPGNYEMAVESAAVPEGQLKARTQFKVTARESLERTLLSLNEDMLRQLSVASGGEYFREEQADGLLAKLAPLSAGNVQVTDTRLNESWWWFGVVIALLTLEWIIRKRAGML
jgi:hypothetical protein